MGGLELRRPKKTPGTSKPKRALAKGDIKDSWEKKMKRKADLQRVRDLSKHIKDELKADADRARASRKANKERREENEKKNMVTQVIRNTKAISKLTPKQRRRANIFLKHEM